MIRLTDIQRATLAFVIETIADEGYPPTVREIAGRFGLSSTNAVVDRLRALERKGCIEINSLVSRGIRIRGIRWQPVPTGEEPNVAVYEALAERARATQATQAPEPVSGRAAS